MSKKQHIYDVNYIVKHNALWHTKDLFVVAGVGFVFGFLAGLIF